MKRLYLIIAGLHSLLVCFGQMQADDSIKVLLNQKIAYETQSELPINDYLETSTQLVSAYISLGMFTEAERVVTSTEKVLSQKGKSNTHPDLYYSRGLIYYSLKNYDEAFLHFKKAKSLFEQLGDNGFNYTFTLSALATIYQLRGQFLFSKMYLDEAVELYNQIKQNNNLDKELFLKEQIASLYKSMGKTEQAATLWKEILSVKGGDRHLIYPMAANNYGILCLEKNNISEAEYYFRKAVTLCNNVFDKELFLQNLLFVSILQNEPDTDRLLLDYNELTKNNVSNIFTYYTESEREEYWNYQAEALTGLNNWAASKTKDNRIIISAYNVNIYAKNMLLNSYRLVKELVATCGQQTLVDQYDALISYKNLLSNKETPADSVGPIKEKINKTEKYILENIPNLTSRVNNMNATYEQVKSSLSDNDVALEFVKQSIPIRNGEDWKFMYSVYLIKNRQDGPLLIELCDADSLEQILDKKDLEYETFIDHLYDKDNEELYNFVWKKLSAHISEGSRVFFSPTGALNTINFNAIPYHKSQLGEIYELIELSTTGVIPDFNNKPNVSFKNATIYGDINYDTDSETMMAQSHSYKMFSPGKHFVLRSINSRGEWGHLYGTAIEAFSVDSILTAHQIDTRLLRQSEANEESFKSLNRNSTDILHVATHGFYLERPDKVKGTFFLPNVSLVKKEQPLLYCGLLFSGANNTWNNNLQANGVEDGILTAEEISHLELSRTKIAIMSACETGLGAIDDIDGVIGIQRGLKKAGVKSIVMSLWTVPDNATCLLMKYFYNNLFSGQNRHTALKNAQKQVKSVYEEPYYWAGFVIID